MLKLFNTVKRPVPIEKARFKPLRFNLSGNILELSIPDNVSPEMPPTELIPDLDINSAETFRGASKIPLMKVMYDFPRPGWRKRDYGSMALTLWLHKKPATFEDDIFQREHLIKAIQVDLKNDYQSFNEKVWNDGLAAGKLSVDLVDEMMNFSGNSDEEIIDHKINSTLWVEHFISGLERHRVYCSAISKSSYLCIDFEDMHSNGTFFDEMIEVSTPYSDAIIKSVNLTLVQNHHLVSKGIDIESQ